MKRVIVWCAVLAAPILFGVAAAESSESSLPLPNPSPEELSKNSLPTDGEMSNSVRAWYYNPALVKPLLQVGAAVEDSILTTDMRGMLAAVVASRNHCLY